MSLILGNHEIGSCSRATKQRAQPDYSVLGSMLLAGNPAGSACDVQGFVFARSSISVVLRDLTVKNFAGEMQRILSADIERS